MARRAASTAGFPDEPGVASAPTVLRPFRSAAGVWGFLEPGEPVPAGATLGAYVLDAATGVIGLDASTTAGLRFVRLGPGQSLRTI